MALKFPVAEILQPHVRDGRTISRRGTWWTAVLAIDSPRDGKPYLELYKWQTKDGQWKKRQSFRINNAKHLSTVIEALNTFAELFTSNDEQEANHDA